MSDVINQLSEVLQLRKDSDPASSYVASLYHQGINHILAKVGEEATETIIAAKDAASSGDNTNLVQETADLWFHTMVMLSHLNATPESVLQELERRFGVSGLTEKSARSKGD